MIKKYMGKEYDSFIEVLEYVAKTKTWSTLTEDTVELQDLLAMETDESLAKLWKEMENTKSDKEITMLNLMLTAWNTKTVITWYNKFVTPWIEKNTELEKEMQNHYEKEMEAVRESQKASLESLKESFFLLQEKFSAAEAKLKQKEIEIITLKARLYDLTISKETA